MKTELTVSLKSAFYNKNRETYYSVRFFDTWLSYKNWKVRKQSDNDLKRFLLS